jgi:F-type H+-transporting ATPase subunit b
MKRDLQAQAEADIAAMRQKAAADIEAAKAQAMADLRGEVANIAIGAAERVVEHNLDPETNKALVESFIDQVGSGRT